jgi:hypothetical protein
LSGVRARLRRSCHGRRDNRVDLDENKTDKPRSWDLRPDVLAAMAIWREHFRKDAASGDRVFVDDERVWSTTSRRSCATI